MGRVFQKFMASVGMAFALFIGCSMAVNAASYADLFDAAYYAEKNPDVVAIYGNNPSVLYAHYMNTGIYEGRNAGRFFDVAEYRKQNPYLDSLYGNNWANYVNHYLTVGLPEGWVGYGEAFDAASYANRYIDLKRLYGYDLKALYAHYVTVGKLEGRSASYKLTDVEQKEAAKKPANVGGGVHKPQKAQQLLTYINRERRAWGMNNLTLDNSLTNMANERVVELATLFSHMRLNEHSVYEYGIRSENIAMLYEDAKDVHMQFMNYWSDANNILDPYVSKVGVACYAVAGAYYWCELFQE